MTDEEAMIEAEVAHEINRLRNENARLTAQLAIAREAAEAALAAIREEYAIVPREPTKAAIQAVCVAIEDTPNNLIDPDDQPYRCAFWENEAKAAYRAMIEAGEVR